MKYCIKCIPDWFAARKNNEHLLSKWTGSVPHITPIADIFGDKVGINIDLTKWTDNNSTRVDTYICMICGYAWERSVTGRQRGIQLIEHEHLVVGDCLFTGVVTINACCWYTGETRGQLGMIFLKKEDVPVLHLIGKYDYESAKECDKLLDNAREKGVGFYHNDTISLRQMALCAIGQ